MIGMTHFDYMIRRLESDVADGIKENADFAERVIKYGAAYQSGWMQDAMRADARGRVAAEALAMLKEQTELSEKSNDDAVDAVVAHLKDRFGRETDYIVPTNTTTVAEIYKVQALQKIAETVSFGKENRETK